MIGGMKNKYLLSIYAMAFLLLGAYITLFNYIAFPLSNISSVSIEPNGDRLLFIFQLSGSWSSYFFGKLTENHSRSSLLISGVVMASAGALLTCTGNLFLLTAGLILFAAGFFAGHSLASGWVGMIADPRIKVYASSFIPVVLLHRLQSSWGTAGGFFLTRFGWYGVIFMISVLFYRHCVVDSYVNPVASSLPQGKFRPPDRLKPKKTGTLRGSCFLKTKNRARRESRGKSKWTQGHAHQTGGFFPFPRSPVLWTFQSHGKHCQIRCLCPSNG